MTIPTTRALDALGGKLSVLQGNQPLVLLDPSTVWIVRSGAMAVFSTAIKNGKPEGARRFLYTATAGHAIFGVAADPSKPTAGFVAVAVRKSEMLSVSLKDLWEGSAGRDGTLRMLLEDWAAGLPQLMLDQHDPPSTPTHVKSSQEAALAEGESLQFSDGFVGLVSLDSGNATMLGIEELKLEPGATELLVGPGMWINAATDSQLTIRDLDDVEDGQGVVRGLALLHDRFNFYLTWLAERERAEEIERQESSSSRRALKAQAALEDLSAVLNPRERFGMRETPLLTAAAIVGDVAGIEIQPPAASEDMSRVKDPVEAIARASRVRVRKVLLQGKWWERDCGPLLAYLGKTERQPVALLRRGSFYDVVDAKDRRRQRLTPELLEELCPDAVMFYRPLQDESRTLWDLISFSRLGRVGDMIFITCTGVAVTLLGMLTPEATSALVDKAIPGADHRLLAELVTLLVAAAFGTGLFTLAQGMVIVRTGTIAEVMTQGAMWDRLLKFRPAFFREYSSGDLQQRVNAVGEVSQELNGSTLRQIVSGIMALLNFFLLWYYSWDLAKVAIGLFLVTLLFTGVAGYFIRRLAVVLQELHGKFYGLVIQVIGGVSKLRVAGAEHRAFNHWVTLYSAQLRYVLGSQRLKDLVNVFNTAVPLISTMVLFWLANDLVSLNPGEEAATDDETMMTMGDFLAFNTAFLLFRAGAADVSNNFVEVLDTISKGKRIKPILEGETEVPESASDPGRLLGAIRFDKVMFRYDENRPLILDGVSFQADPGEFLAFAGPSGSGKSTVLRLLLGFETPEAGSVLFDGQDLAGLDVLAVRRQVGVVLQNGRLGAGSLFDNIANNARLTFDEVFEAAADAGLSDDIEEMPMGLHTIVSEGGTNLSGGQRQRLLIARALALRPKLVFFDEATSALDNRTQAIVSEALDRRRVTRVVIAHRLSTIEKADRIYVLDAGRIMQQGSFQELAEQEGLFKRLVARQIA